MIDSNQQFEGPTISAEEAEIIRARSEKDRCENWINGLPRAAVSNAVTGALTFFLLREQPGRASAYGWLMTILMINIVRLAMTPKLKTWISEGKTEWAKQWLTVSLWVSGIIWSLPAVVFFPKYDLAMQAILAVALLSVSAGAVLNYVVSPRLALVVPCLVLVPFTLQIFTESGPLPVILSLLCVLFLTIVFFMERDWSQYIEQNLKLSIHNQMLSEKYRRAHGEAVEAIHTKEQFLRKMSHEIRTPLNGIQGMTKLLLTQVGNGVNRQSLKVIEESSDRLLLLIKELFGEFGEKAEITEEAVNSLFLVDPAENETESRGTILIVEDNPVNQMVLGMHLEKRGFRIETADNGEKALQWQREMTFDAVLMDCQMPVMDGFETTRRWRQAEKDSEKRTPIIAVTANAVAGDRDRCLEAGMNDYVPKPIDPNLLFQKLSTYLAPAPKKNLEKNHVGLNRNTRIELNLNALEALRDFDDGKGEVLVEVVKKYLETTQELLAGFPALCESHKYEEVRHVAHTVKSSSATVGAGTLSEMAKHIEHCMREKKYETLAKDCESLMQLFEASRAALNEYIEPKRKAA